VYFLGRRILSKKMDEVGGEELLVRCVNDILYFSKSLDTLLENDFCSSFY
jgi:hypothetical protein